MTKPIRIQRRRTKGWKMPPNTAYVGRPTKWGNPFVSGHPYETVAAGWAVCRDPQHAVDLFTPIAWCRRDEIRAELRGQNLACWCPLDQPCHADVLLRIANGPICEAVP